MPERDGFDNSAVPRLGDHEVHGSRDLFEREAKGGERHDSRAVVRHRTIEEEAIGIAWRPSVRNGGLVGGIPPNPTRTDGLHRRRLRTVAVARAEDLLGSRDGADVIQVSKGRDGQAWRHPQEGVSLAMAARIWRRMATRSDECVIENGSSTRSHERNRARSSGTFAATPAATQDKEISRGTTVGRASRIRATSVASSAPNPRGVSGELPTFPEHRCEWPVLDTTDILLGGTQFPEQ